MKISNIIFILIFFSIGCCKINAQTENIKSRPVPELNFSELEKKNFPKSLFFVNDFENLLSNEQILDLEIIINDFRIKTKNEIVILSVNSISPYTDISNYTVDLSNYLQIGKDGNGLTIVVSKELRKVQIATGNVTEKIISGEECDKVINELMIPNFKNDKYYEGLKSGLLELIEMWK
jgi:uncharacterized protein